MRLAHVEIDGERWCASLDADDRPECLIARGDIAAVLDTPAESLDRLHKAGRTASTSAPARFLAPLRPGKIVAIGLNYLDHIREAGMEAPAAPLIFTKFTTSIIATGEPVVIDASLTQRVDWEVELAVVIGRRARAVGVDDALSYVLGYTVANDVSARDIQFADGQWVRGKSLDTFCPLGPLLVTADEIPDPQNLRLRTLVNDDVVQDSKTSEMVFGVAELIAYCSQSFTLEPGDVLLTGTPWGCGEFMTPPRSLHPGDRLRTEIEGIGVLDNPVVSSGDARPST